MTMMVELSLTLVRRLKLWLQSNEVAFHHRIVIVETPSPNKLFYTITSHILIHKLLNIINLFAFFPSLFILSVFFGLFVEHCVCVRAFHFFFPHSVWPCYFRYPIRFEVLRCVCMLLSQTHDSTQ